jgi:hypothetical protein
MAMGNTEPRDSLQQIPGLPDRADRPVFNAENITITADGRIFVTGSTAVYEISKAVPDIYQLKEIAIAAQGVPGHCFKNGIGSHNHSLYLACTHINCGDHPFLGSAFGDPTNIDENGLGLFALLLAETLCEVGSYIVQADLRQAELRFDRAVTLPGRCFANGLDLDNNGNLYTANSAPRAIAAIYKISCTKDGTMSPMPTPWHSPLDHGLPNGVKVRGDHVYLTCLHLLPTLSASLQRVRIMPDGSAGEPEIIYRRMFTVFDDFDTVDTGFVIANITDISEVPTLASWASYGSGKLRFVNNDGQDKGELAHPDLRHPSSVKVVRKEINGFAAGDILITDKGNHCTLRFAPDTELRKWLVGP